MAEVHVLTKNGQQLRLVLHVPIPAGSNSANIGWQAALVSSGLIAPSVLIAGDGTNGTIDATETSALAAGSLFERVVDYDMGSGFDALNAAGKNAQVDTVYNTTKTELQDQLKDRLKYCGYTREVP